MGKTKTYTSKRQWLNPIDSCNSGAIQYKVTSYTPCEKEDFVICATLSIWDCSKKITLDFGIWEEKDAKKVAKKIEMLQDALQDMRESIGKAYQDSVENRVDTDD